MNATIGIAALVVLAFGFGWFVMKWMARQGSAEYRGQAESLKQISALSLKEAETLALQVLTEGASSRSTKSATTDTGALSPLAPELRKFMEAFEVVAFEKGSQASVARATIGPSALKPGFVRIGAVAVGTDVEGEISVRPGEEAVYELYAAEEPDPVFGTYRSIYHWVLAMAKEK